MSAATSDDPVKLELRARAERRASQAPADDPRPGNGPVPSGSRGTDQAKRASAIEQDTIGALLKFPEAWTEASAVGLTIADFEDTDLRRVYKGISELAIEQKPRTVSTVAAHLEETGQHIAGGWFAFFGPLVRETLLQPERICEQVKALRRRAIMRVLGTTDESEVRVRRRALAELDALNAPPRPQALELESAATWADRSEPPVRDWVIEGLIPAARVTSLLGNGGLGKSIIAGQIGLHVATGRPLFGLNVCGGAVLGIFCEDERDELERRIRAATSGENLDLTALEQFYPCSRDGMENLLCTFVHDEIVLTDFHQSLEATVALMRPRLLILDTAADLFAGDYVSTPHVRQFIKVALGRFCVRYGCAVLLIGHPSASAINSGDGSGFSTAWNNSVRSRLYLRPPKSGDSEAIADRRVLQTMKSNYGPSGATIPLLYHRGSFILDPEPVDDGRAAVRKAAKVDTRLSMATMTYLQQKAPSGQVVSFGAIFETLQASGHVEHGSYETVRKPLQRCLKSLVAEGLLTASNVPRGYRLAQSVSP